MSKTDNRKGRSRREICLKLTINKSKKKSDKSITVNKEMFIVQQKRT